ncbi:MAG: hypothetical protein V4613_15040 [Bacteroidota bacterium]
MKAIKYSAILFLSVSIMQSCKPTDQVKQVLDPSSKDYFEVKNGSTYTFTEISDTTISINYTSENYLNNQSNPDIENNEIMSYDLVSNGHPKISIRTEAGGSTYKDRIAMITNRNDTNYVGPIIFNLGGTFSKIQNSRDTVFQYPSYTINNRTFTDVIRIVLYGNNLYLEVFYAKNIGLIGRKERAGKFYYVKKYSVNK